MAQTDFLEIVHEKNVQPRILEHLEKIICFTIQPQAFVNFETQENTLISHSKSVLIEMVNAQDIEVIKPFVLLVHP